MTINNEILEALKEVGLSKDDGMPYLISLYYGYDPSYIPDIVKAKINRTGIVDSDGNRGLNWKIPLFEQQETNFDWVKTEWIPLFEEVNERRRGNGNTAISRMKKFFAKYPQYRKEDVMEATRIYIENLTSPQYLTTSHFFIYKGVGANKTEQLAEWCEKLEIARKSMAARRSSSNTMI